MRRTIASRRRPLGLSHRSGRAQLQLSKRPAFCLAGAFRQWSVPLPYFYGIICANLRVPARWSRRSFELTRSPSFRPLELHVHEHDLAARLVADIVLDAGLAEIGLAGTAPGAGCCLGR